MRLSTVVLSAALIKSSLGDNGLTFNHRPSLDNNKVGQDGNHRHHGSRDLNRDRRRMQLDKTCREPFYQLSWDQLSDSQRWAAHQLGYNSASWNKDEEPKFLKDAGWTDFSSTNQSNWLSLEITAGIFEDAYEDLLFHELPLQVKDAVVTLGYTIESWDEDTYSPLMISKTWSELTDGERDAALLVGHDCFYWTSFRTKYEELPASIRNRAIASDATNRNGCVDEVCDPPKCDSAIFGFQMSHTPCDELDLFSCHLACHCKVGPVNFCIFTYIDRNSS